MSKISLIIPVYNVEPYLEKCLDSVVNQTHQPDEIIIVDDGSTDNSLSICKIYSENHDNITVLSQKNSGVTQAIYRGIDHSTGDYICIVDSDDFIELNMIENLYINIENYQADMCKCNAMQFSDGEIREFPGSIIDKRIELNDKKEIVKAFLKRNISTYYWDAIYKRELFDSVDYRHIKKHANMFMLLDIVLLSKKVVVIPDVLYYYRERGGSIVNSFDKNRLKQIEGIKYLKKRLKEHEMFEELSQHYYALYCRNMLRIVKDVVKYNNYKNYSRYYDKIIREIELEDIEGVGKANELSAGKKSLFIMMINRKMMFYLRVYYIITRNKINNKHYNTKLEEN